MKAGLFGGGWEDYLDALNEAFDRHVAENMPPHPFGASVDAIMTGYADGRGAAPGLLGDIGGVGAAQPSWSVVPINLSRSVPEAIDPDAPRNETAQDNSGAPTQMARAEPTRDEVLSTVDEANKFAADLYNRYSNKANPPTAEDRARDQGRVQQLQDRLTQLSQANLPQPDKAGSNLSNNIMGASLYLLQAAQAAGIGSTAIPPAAGGAMFGMDGPPDTMHPGQKIGPHY